MISSRTRALLPVAAKQSTFIVCLMAMFTVNVVAEDRIAGHTHPVYSVAISPDGKLLASASLDNTVKLWKLKTGKLLGTLNGHGDGVACVAFSPNGKTLASCSLDSSIKLWDLGSKSLKATLSDHSMYVSCVTFSADGKLLASSSYDKTVRLWTADGAAVATLTGHQDTVHFGTADSGSI